MSPAVLSCCGNWVCCEGAKEGGGFFVLLRGIIPPVAMPLDDQERVDAPALRALVQALLTAGVHGLFVLGSTGEFAHLADREKERAVEIVLAEVDGKVPVLVGATDTGTRRALQWATLAQRQGVAAIVVAPPFYYPLTEAEVERHYRVLASECAVPIIAYHIPATTKVWFSVDLVERLAEAQVIVGLKDSSGDLTFTFALIDRLRGRSFAIFQGHDALVAPSLLYGAHGGINALANLVPEWFVALYDAAQQQNSGVAFSWQQRINALARRMEAFPFLPALKTALHLRWGLPERVTAPWQALSEEQKAVLRTALQESEVPLSAP